MGIFQGATKKIVVQSGSMIRIDDRLPFQKGQAGSEALRQKLIDNKIIVDRVFVQDYEFSSTSAAASVISGQSASGMIAWKDDRGRNLTQISSSLSLDSSSNTDDTSNCSDTLRADEASDELTQQFDEAIDAAYDEEELAEEAVESVESTDRTDRTDSCSLDTLNS